MKGWKTQLANGNPHRNMVETLIDKRYGSVHVTALGLLPGYGFKPRYEIDCYFPDLHLGIEIDEKHHRESSCPRKGSSFPQGYHFSKDAYFKSLGIDILHIVDDGTLWFKWNTGDIQPVIESFLEGKYTGVLIETKNSIYGDIVYESCS